MIRLIGIFVSLNALVVASLAQIHTERPNVLIILTDDQGFGDMSLLNPDAKLKTPHMDALAKEGVFGTDAHAPATVCSPSRYALLTGRYAFRGKLKAGRLNPWAESVIEEDRNTIADMLKAKGYHTACIGKWHLGFEWPWADGVNTETDILDGGNSLVTPEMIDWSKPIGDGVLGAGFDYYFGDDVPNMPPYLWIENDRVTCDPVQVDKKTLMSIGDRGHFHGSGPGEEGWEIDQVMPTITAKAVKYIEEQSKSKAPFFLYFSTTSPHAPHAPVKAFQGSCQASHYGDFVVQTDHHVGELISALKEAGIFEDTLVFVSSDNGAAPFTHKVLQEQGHNASGKLRGWKRDLLEGGHRVPFIASWPNGGIKGGKEIDAMINLTDIYATLAGVVGAELAEKEAEDSFDIMNSLLENKPVRTEMIYHAWNSRLGLRQGNWAYLRANGIQSDHEWYRKLMGYEPVLGKKLLFNLAEDLGQKKSVLDQHSAKADEMEARLKELESAGRTR